MTVPARQRDPRTARRSAVYLESMDSVRAAWGDRQAFERAREQLTTEAVVALAFGRPLAVQRSYAFDSWVVQDLLSDLWAAHEAADLPTGSVLSRPVVLKLHGDASFAGAASSILAKLAASGGREVFSTSLYPDLAQLPAEQLAGIARDLGDGSTDSFLRVLDDHRRRRFIATWNWFGHTTAGHSDEIVPPADHAPGSVSTLLEPILRHRSDVLRGCDEAGLDPAVTARVADAVHTLHEADVDGAPFASRSRLRDDRPWDRRGATAEDLVGAADLELVREVVDTLYNRVVWASMAHVQPVFSTQARPAGVADDLAAAQSLALRSTELVSGEGATTETTEFGEIRFGDRSPAEPREPSLRLSDARVETFTALLRLSVDPAWQTSLDVVSGLRPGSGAARKEDALRSHIDLLGARFGRTVDDSTDPTGWRLALGAGLAQGAAATAAAGVSAYVDGSLTGILAGAVAGAAAAGEVAAARAAGRRREKRAVRRVADQFARYVSIGEEPA